MFPAVLSQTLAQRKRALVGWCLGVATTTVLIGMLWPMMRDMADLNALLENYPPELKELFNVDAMGTPDGFVNAEYFSLLGPLLFLVFGIALGARLPATDEEQGALDVLLSTPLTRVRLLAEQAGALVTSVVLLGLVQLLSLGLTSATFDMGIGVGRMAGASLALVLLGAEFGLLALAVGAFTGRRGWALGVASVLAAASYLFWVATSFLTWLEPWQWLSPMTHAIGSEPLINGLPTGSSLAMAAVALGALLAALPVFDRRDLATA